MSKGQCPVFLTRLLKNGKIKGSPDCNCTSSHIYTSEVVLYL